MRRRKIQLLLLPDMWSDKYTQRHFLSLTIHYINADWKLVHHLLAVDEFLGERKTADNIRDECARILRSFFDTEEVSSIMKNSWMVTDGGSNMQKVFENRHCHKINLAIHWLFNDKKTGVDPEKEKPNSAKKLFVLSTKCPQIKGALHGVKDVVAYFKRAGLNSKLPYSLKQDVQTRWNSELIMLESYLKSAQEVQQILLEKGKLQKLSSIDISIVQELVGFLKPFLECSASLSGDKYPPIHLVAPWFLKLRRHLQEDENDSAEIRLLKQQGHICLQEYMKIDSFLWTACLLNPRYKTLKGATDEERKDAYDRMKILMISLAQAVGTAGRDSVESIVGKSSPIANKGKFAEFEDSSDEELDDDPEVVAKKELDSYLAMKYKVLDYNDEGQHILKFWCGATQFPLMQKIAQRILSIPASQASDERVFSSTGLTLTARRTELSGSTLSNLTFVHKNYDLFF
ncbi:uncharacterized protein LOC110856457 [Folsomia candida]|uniref:uncharacterized protein LOC110856457 n=1 Tax=Folsomia candida TaxID=158441 RepID=UPI001604DCBB|nr:uncharacterized protein LOC110856457 [Folsomia candida]